MLASASPLSGLHKLAVSICARKRDPHCTSLDSGPAIGKENAGPVAPLLDNIAFGQTPSNRAAAGGKAGRQHGNALMGQADSGMGTGKAAAVAATTLGVATEAVHKAAAVAIALGGATEALDTRGAAKGSAAVVPRAEAVRDGARRARAGQVAEGSGPKTWDQYVAAQLRAGPDKQRQAKLVAVLKRELKRSGRMQCGFCEVEMQVLRSSAATKSDSLSLCVVPVSGCLVG